MWTHEESIETTASPVKIWELFSDVAGWKRWNAGIERIELHGPFVEGTTFTMQPPGSEAFLSTLIDVQKNEAFVDETVIDDTRVVVHHGITALGDGGSRILYRTEITGPVAEEIGPFVTEDFGSVLAALKKIAEA